MIPTTQRTPGACAVAFLGQSQVLSLPTPSLPLSASFSRTVLSACDVCDALHDTIDDVCHKCLKAINDMHEQELKQQDIIDF